MGTAPVRKTDGLVDAANNGSNLRAAITIPDCPICQGEPIIYVTRGANMYVFDMVDGDRVSLKQKDLLTVFCTVCEQEIGLP